MLFATSYQVKPHILLLALGAMIAVAVGGCSASVSTGGEELNQSQEEALATQLIHTKLTAVPATKTVDCDSGVDAKTGTKYSCTATFVNGQTATLPFVVSSVKGGSAIPALDPDVANQAQAVDLVYSAGASQANAPVKSVSCPADAPAKTGSTLSCNATLTTGDTFKVTLALGPGGSMRVVNIS